MKPGDRVRMIYERRPYPFGDGRALKTPVWSLNLDWVRTFAAVPAGLWPRRVLVAGCGDGSEAFGLQRRLPNSEIVAVDFSARSIGLARRFQRGNAEARRIRFEVADLSAAGLAALTGGNFDFVCCHGVMSYIPALSRALANLRRCLSPQGVLYLGVNGATHVGVRFRAAFPKLGLDPEDYRENPATEAALLLAESVIEGDGLPRVIDLGPHYVASDIFGSPNHTFALDHWLRLATGAGLHFRSCGSAVRLCRRVEAAGRFAALLPRSRSETAEMLELLSPSQFHRLLFTSGPQENPPWTQPRQLRRWTMERSRIYRARFPKLGRMVRDRVRPVRVSSSTLRLDIEWRMPEWEIKLLQEAKAGKPLSQMLAALPLEIPFADLRQQLYLLHQFGIVTLQPPPA